MENKKTSSFFVLLFLLLAVAAQVVFFIKDNVTVLYLGIIPLTCSFLVALFDSQIPWISAVLVYIIFIEEFWDGITDFYGYYSLSNFFSITEILLMIILLIYRIYFDVMKKESESSEAELGEARGNSGEKKEKHFFY